MWISRKQWDELVKRVDRCDAAASRAESEIDKVDHAARVPGALRLVDDDYGRHWEVIPPGECVSAIAKHLGVTFASQDGVPAVPPKVLVVKVKRK